MRHATLFLRRITAVICLIAATAQSHAAAQYTLLHGFAGAPSDGGNPLYGSLATDGTVLYGFTQNGGVTNKGAVFKINASGSGFQVLHSFNGLNIADILLHNPGNLNDGEYIDGTPCLISSTIYGTTVYGGTNGQGVVFKINTDGTGFALLHNFGANATDGNYPYGGLVTDGTTLYGMTSSSGSALGTIFSVDTNGGNYHIMHIFNPVTTDGAVPQGGLLLSGGVLYGMTQHGGTLGSGTIFQISTNGTGFQLLHSFTGTVNDGGYPYGSLIISGSTLYGMTTVGGANNVGTAFSMDTSGGNFTILHSFSTTNTWAPYGDLTLSGSTLYGMAKNSGTSLLSFGTIFQMNTNGSGFQIPHVFSYGGANLTDGSTPSGSLLLLGSKLYGMTYFGGSSHNAGTVFSFDPAGSGGGGGGSGPVTALRVTILPSTAVKAGAQWQDNGGTLMNSGALETNLYAGAHVVSYKAVPGFITPAPQIIDIGAGVTNTITGTYGIADTTAPVLKIVAPTSKTVANTNSFTASGTASDAGGLAGVYYQLNGGAWTPATGSTNWTVNLDLTAGPNVLKVYAKDTSGNVSATNSVTFTYTVSVPVLVAINIPGAGSVSPNLNGQAFPIGGKALKLAAKATKGFAFVNWTGSTNTTSSKISFVVQSNLVFYANFKDITRPTDVILAPTKGQVFSNSVASGRAMDNVGVTAIYYQLNGGTWTLANSGDGTNWQTADLSGQFVAGANTISTYAVDAAGNASLTNTIAFSYQVSAVADWAPNSLNGLLAVVSPDSGAQLAVGFDQTTFSETSSSNDGNPDDYGGGTFTYSKTDTNMAQLSLAFNAPPGSSNSIGPINLIFTNHYAGYFTNDPSDVGTITLRVANAVVPTTLVGKTLTAVSSGNGKSTKIKLTSATAFTKTPANNSSSGSSAGTYTFTRLSPICAVLSATFTSPADVGQTAYLQLTYTSASGGTYFVMVFDGSGTLQDIDTGTFSM